MSRDWLERIQLEHQRKLVFKRFWTGRVKSYLAELEKDLQNCQEQAKNSGNRVEAFHTKTDLLLLQTVRHWLNSRTK